MILIFVNRPRMSRMAAAALTLALVAGGCGSAPGDSRPLVVVTTTVLGDLVSEIAGDAAEVEVLIPVGVDPHDYQPSSRQTARIAAADLVVTNGLGLEEGLTDAINSASADVLAVAPLVDPLPFAGGSDLDPHVWLDPVRMADAAGLIADRMTEIDPGGGYVDRGAAVAADLLAGDATIRGLLAAIPAERRLLVTNHESFGYFAERYGLTVVGVVIPGGSTLAEPSSAELAALVAVIRQWSVPAIFVETTQPTALAEAVAAEVGAPVAVIELHTESLGAPGTPAATLAGMLIEDARLIASALGGD